MADRDRAERAARADQATADQHDDGGDGHSIAAWVTVGTVMLGAFVMSVAVVAGLVWLFVVGGVVVLVGMVLGKVLHGMGFGETAPQPPPHGSKQGIR